MWARVIEIMLACWLAVSPFIFRHAASERRLWWTDLGCALAVSILSLLSFWPPLRHANLAIISVGLWLIGFGLLAAPYPTPPALQNDILVGLLLLMLAIVPNEANLPPRAWIRFLTEEKALPAHYEIRQRERKEASR
jgi:hypothetical protein